MYKAFSFLVLVKCYCYYCKKQRNEATLFECTPILCSYGWFQNVFHTNQAIVLTRLLQRM